MWSNRSETGQAPGSRLIVRGVSLAWHPTNPPLHCHTVVRNRVDLRTSPAYFDVTQAHRRQASVKQRTTSKAVDRIDRVHALGLEIAERSAELNDRPRTGAAVSRVSEYR